LDDPAVFGRLSKIINQFFQDNSKGLRKPVKGRYAFILRRFSWINVANTDGRKDVVL
jgi:hypothetical protein